MSKGEIPNLIGGYLRSRKRLLLFYFLWSVAFLTVFFVYEIPFKVFGYALLIASSGAITVLGIDVVRYQKKHRHLQGMLGSIAQELSHLPVTTEPIELDYQALLTALQAEKAELSSKWQGQMTDLMEYYTLWTHQIKTPIAAMKLLLQEGEYPQEAQALQELFKIERYVELAIQYARLESMSSDLRIESLELDDIIKSAVKKYATIFIGKKIKLNYQESHCNVLTDKKWLVFVLEQLLSNALKYTMDGSISIYMSPNEEKTLILEDTGIGIREEDLPRIFEKGFTGYNGRLDQKSTGIGLSLSKKVLDKLAHPIKITSEIGKGTRVAIDLSREKMWFD